MKRAMRNRIFVAMLCGLVSVGMLPANVWAENQELVLTDETFANELEKSENEEEAPPENENEQQSSMEEANIPEDPAAVREDSPSLPERNGAEILIEDPDEFAVEDENVLLSSDKTEGTCGLEGAPVYWKFQDGVMTISGKGEMDDFCTLKDWNTGEIISENPQPWEDFLDLIEEVVIEEGVTTIGYNAFFDCCYLEKVSIASSVKTIRHNAFANCYYFSELHMGEGVETLEDCVFYGSSLTELTLPKSLRKMTNYSLLGLQLIENVYVEDGNPVFQSKDGILFTDNWKTLRMFPVNRQTAYHVPDGTTKIAAYAFEQSHITEVYFPDSVTEIGDWAFNWCGNLKIIVFPKSLKVISTGICCDNTSLVSVTIPEGVTKVQQGAFSGCTSLSEVTLPSSVKTVEDAFEKNTTVHFSGNGLYRREDGTFIDAVMINVSASEKYTKAFEVLSLVNKERTKRGLAALKMDTSLLETAMQRAYETVLYWNHTRPTGSSCFTANSLMYGENIAYGSTTAASVMNLWMNSAGHKANILGDYKTIGIGCVYHNGTYYWVQCFGIDSSSVAKSSSYKDRSFSRTVAVLKDPKYYSASFKISRNSLNVGDKATVTVYWNGSQLKNSGAVIKSSDTSVCKVSGGTIRAVSPGTTVIKVYFPGYEEKAFKKKVTVKGTQIKVLYNANGGTVKSKYKTVTYGKTYGTLASPVRSGYVFDGWYTKKNGGTKITSSSKVTVKTNQTLYAHWKKVKIK